MLRGRHIIGVRLAAAAITSLGLAGAAALAGTTAHSGTAGATPGVPAQARASAPWIPAARPGIGTAYVVNAHSDTMTPIAIATNRAGPPSRWAATLVRSLSAPTARPPTWRITLLAR